MTNKTIYAISDSIGETAESVVRATASQYDKERFDIVRVPYVETKKQIDDVLRDAHPGSAIPSYPQNFGTISMDRLSPSVSKP